MPFWFLFGTLVGNNSVRTPARGRDDNQDRGQLGPSGHHSSRDELSFATFLGRLKGGGARACPIIMMLVSREQSGNRAEPAGAWTRTGLLTGDGTISPPFFPFLQPLPASWSEWSGSGSASEKPQNSDPPAPIPGVWLLPWPVALLPKAASPRLSPPPGLFGCLLFIWNNKRPLCGCVNRSFVPSLTQPRANTWLERRGCGGAFVSPSLCDHSLGA